MEVNWAATLGAYQNRRLFTLAILIFFFSFYFALSLVSSLVSFLHFELGCRARFLAFGVSDSSLALISSYKYL